MMCTKMCWNRLWKFVGLTKWFSLSEIEIELMNLLQLKEIVHFVLLGNRIHINGILCLFVALSDCAATTVKHRIADRMKYKVVDRLDVWITNEKCLSAAANEVWNAISNWIQTGILLVGQSSAREFAVSSDWQEPAEYCVIGQFQRVFYIPVSG